MWFFEYFFKKGLYKPQKTIYNANENKEKQHKIKNKQHKTTTQQNCPFMDEIGGILL